MKLNKKLIKKKNKKNKKKQKKIIKHNVDVVAEKIAFILDKADLKYIKNITTILTPKIALRICNQASDVEYSGGLNDPDAPTKRLTKLKSFLYLIENDSTISENKKNKVFDRNVSQTKIDKKICKKIKKKVHDIQSDLDKLRLTQLKNELNVADKNQTSNYFAIESLNKLNEQSRSGRSDNGFIKQSTFNLNMTGGVPTITPNYSNNSVLSQPKLDLNKLNYNSNSSTGQVDLQTISDPNLHKQTHTQVSCVRSDQNAALRTDGQFNGPTNLAPNNFIAKGHNQNLQNIQLNIDRINNTQANHFHNNLAHNNLFNQFINSSPSAPSIGAQNTPNQTSKGSVASLFGNA